MNKRPKEITQQFNDILDNHLEKIVLGENDVFLKIQDIANIMHIHPVHLSNTIKEVTSKSRCDICNEKTINVAKKLLLDNEITISEIVKKLTFESTNFTKYFKKHTNKTPSDYRKQILK